MARPHIVRADTIDLQSQSSPSAKDHTRQPSHTSAVGPPAPHQAETLREVALEAEQDQARSPRVSEDWSNSAPQFGTIGAHTLTDRNLQQQDVHKEGQAHRQTVDSGFASMSRMDEEDGDDDLDDDDMMDKISSSPSIDDGGCPLPTPGHQSLGQVPIAHGTALCHSTPACSDRGSSERSSSPFLDGPVHSPLRLSHLVDPDSQAPDSICHLPSSEVKYQETMDGTVSQIYGMLGGTQVILPTSSSDSLPRPGLKLVPTPRTRTDGPNTSPRIFQQSSPGQLNILTHGRNRSHLYDEAAMTVPYESSEDGDEDDERPIPDDSRFIDSGWGGDCLQDLEDIDFEFVYALHTFVATVEGQANATKGDTMVLLDDSNSYWWLVRVVKDSSIGYLPAEHIETPTERLARLNKHRNIDLSAAMLGDQSDKPKNPLKKAMKRRNAKTVVFAPPTYVEASDHDWSSSEDEEDGDEELYAAQQKHSSVEGGEAGVDASSTELSQGANSREEGGDLTSDIARNSDEIFDSKAERQTRNGTVRNTDSFFKDETVETKKITITPNILRDDSSSSTRTSNELKEIRQRASLDKLDREDKSTKEDKKKKDKKHGILGGLFKRKDKKAKNLQDDDPDDLIYGKKSSDESRSSPVPSKDSSEAGLADDSLSPQRSISPLRAIGNAQKPSRAESSLVKQVGLINPAIGDVQPAPTRSPIVTATVEPSLRLVKPDVEERRVPSPGAPLTPVSLQSGPGSSRSPTAPIVQATQTPEVRSLSTETVTATTARTHTENFDDSTERSLADKVAYDPLEESSSLKQRPIPGAFPDSYVTIPTPSEEPAETEQARDWLCESLSEVSLAEPVYNLELPALMVDTSSQDDEHASLASSPSPDLIQRDDDQDKKELDSVSSTSRSTPTWSDEHLRTFFEDDADIRDLLVVVYDKSGVVPAGPNHPITGSLFKNEQSKLTDITNRLDGMLGDWLARKSKDVTGSR